MTEHKRPTKVFISYSRKDLAFVEQLVADLEKVGLEVWYDLSGLKVGERWETEISKAIEESKFVVVVLSPDSVASKWVRKEYLYADSLKKEFIPLVYRPCNLRLFFQDLHYIEVQGEKYEQIYGKILHGLGLPLRQFEPEIETDKVAREKAEREAAEKARREKAEREAAEKTAREAAERKAAENARRERAERQAARRAALQKSAPDLPPKNWSKTNVRIGPNRRQKQWQNGRYFQQNRSS